MQKRHLAVLVAALLLISSLAGCQSAAPSATPAPVATTAVAESAAPTTAPTPSEPVKLTFFSIVWSTDFEFPHPIQTKLAKDANVDITWKTQGFMDWLTKKTVMLASGDLPDCFFGCAAINDTDVNTGLFVDLAPYIEKTVNVKQFLTEMPEAKVKATNLDGTVFGIPNKIPLRPLAGDVFYVCNTWRDKLGLKNPTTTDEYEEFLKACVTQDPNGNGKADEIGFTGVGKGMGNGYQIVGGAGTLGMFFPAFGVVLNNDSLCMIKDGQVVFGPTMDGFRQCCEWLNKLWSENLIDHEFFNLDYPTQAAKYANKDCLLVASGNGWTIENNVGSGYVKDYEAILPLAGPNGDRYFQSDPYVYRLQGNMVCVPTTCKDVDAVMRFVDLCYDNYNCMQLAYGSEGIGIAKDANGNPMFLPIPEGETSSSFKIKNGMDAFAPGWSSEAFDKSIVPSSNDMCLKASWDEMYSPYFLKSAWFPYVKYDTATMEELATLKTDINGFIDQTMVDFVSNGVTDAKWDTFKNQLTQMGLAHLLEIYTKGYQDSLK
jgi:putative aldouronate transport system substrate-binding protein